MAIFGLMALIVVLGLLGGPAFAGYLAATEEQPGWTLVQGICLTVLALYFGWISVHDARVALEGDPFPGVRWWMQVPDYPLYTTRSGALAPSIWPRSR